MTRRAPRTAPALALLLCIAASGPAAAEDESLKEAFSEVGRSIGAVARETGHATRDAVKATGAPGYCSGPYPFTSMHPYLRQIYDAFGPERMFWGTDITKMPCSWRQCVTMFTEELPWLPERDKPLVMGEAVCAWWGWSQPR